MPGTAPLSEIALGRGWPLLPPSPDALVASRCSPQGNSIKTELAPALEAGSDVGCFAGSRTLHGSCEGREFFLHAELAQNGRLKSASGEEKIEEQKTRTREYHKVTPTGISKPLKGWLAH
jgi:hypothetical protein